MTVGLVIHVVHCAGTQMIAQGTDGLSGGNFLVLEGIIKGDNFLSYPRSAYELSPDLEGWFKGMFRNIELEVMLPKDWFQ